MNKPFKPDFTGKASRMPGVNQQIKQADSQCNAILSIMVGLVIFMIVFLVWVFCLSNQ